MKSYLALIVSVLISITSFGQIETKSNETDEINFRIGLSTKLFLIPQRSLFLPISTLNSKFYQENFGLPPTVKHIDRGVATTQIAGNFALLLNPYNKKFEFELGFDFGYQYSGKINKEFYSVITNSDTTYRNAEILINYNLHELSSGGYIIIKSKDSHINLYIGIGLGHYFSIGKADVTNSILGNPVETYKTEFIKYSNFTPYIPLGFEIPLGKEKENFYLKIMGSIRKERFEFNSRPNRFFLTGGVQFQYQF